MSLKRVLDIIRKGTYGSKGLPKSINDFFAQNSKLVKLPNTLLDKLFTDLLDGYDLSPTAETGTSQSSGTGIVNPKIVLTQSFS
jgi:hypothetical protein